MVKVLEDAVPHVAWQTQRLYEKYPHIAEGHLPGNSFIWPLGGGKAPKDKTEILICFLVVGGVLE